MRNLIVGDIVRCTRPILDNDEGAEGVVYEEYDIGQGPGVSVIFENGEYDGFSLVEQSVMLVRIGHEESLADYHFTNVRQLSRDFNNGFFNIIFE